MAKHQVTFEHLPKPSPTELHSKGETRVSRTLV